MRKLSLLSLSVLFMMSTQAQDPNNLVPNPSFEEVDKRIKEEGQLTNAAPWTSATMSPVDLYSADAKGDEMGVPENKYGKEQARTGINYAGVAFYGYRGRRARTYLQAPLTKALEAGKKYCVKYHISLSDMSKYASNNISAHLTKEEVNEQSEANLSLEPHVQSLTNKIYEQQFLWTEVCGQYEAQGGEKFLVIGNFKSDENTLLEKIRLSREFTGRQFYDAYYYIDDVSVIPMDKLSEGDCMCDEIAGGKMEVEYKSFGSTADPSANKKTIYNSDGTVGDEKSGEAASEESSEELDEVEEEGFNINTVTIYFNSKKWAPTAAEEAKLDEIADYMTKNPKVKLQIIGHADPSESSVAFIGKRRGLTIEKKLKDLGVPEARLSYISKETDEPHSSGKAEKNQRVTFTIK